MCTKFPTAATSFDIARACVRFRIVRAFNHSASFQSPRKQFKLTTAQRPLPNNHCARALPTCVSGDADAHTKYLRRVVSEVETDADRKFEFMENEKEKRP
jgi:hypothetical protein